MRMIIESDFIEPVVVERGNGVCTGLTKSCPNLKMNLSAIVGKRRICQIVPTVTG